MLFTLLLIEEFVFIEEAAIFALSVKVFVSFAKAEFCSDCAVFFIEVVFPSAISAACPAFSSVAISSLTLDLSEIEIFPVAIPKSRSAKTIAAPARAELII